MKYNRIIHWQPYFLLLTVELNPWVLAEGPREKADAETRRLAASKNFMVIYLLSDGIKSRVGFELYYDEVQCNIVNGMLYRVVVAVEYTKIDGC